MSFDEKKIVDKLVRLFFDKICIIHHLVNVKGIFFRQMKVCFQSGNFCQTVGRQNMFTHPKITRIDVQTRMCIFDRQCQLAAVVLEIHMLFLLLGL